MTNGKRSKAYFRRNENHKEENPERSSSDAECHAVGGAPWRGLPEHYGSWSTVYSRFRRWQIAGIWNQILDHVSTEPDLESIMIDVTIVRVHQHWAGAKGMGLNKP